METFETFHKSRIFPDPRVENPQRAILSVIDSSSARFSPASAVWLYSAHPDFLTFDRLKQSLILTLSNYPQFCGQLEWADKPLGKLAIRWGQATDDNPVFPGVLQLEALAQTGGVLVLNNQGGPEKKFDTYFLKIDNARFKQKVMPGDTLIMKWNLPNLYAGEFVKCKVQPM